MMMVRAFENHEN